MAKSSCIMVSTAEKMKQAIRDGDINIKDLYSMTTDERRGVFEQFASRELAQEINASFERAMVSKQKSALQKWAEKTFTPEQRTSKAYQNITERIGELDELGVLNKENADSYLKDLISDQMGASVSVEEIKTIAEKTARLNELYNTRDKFGLPEVGYWQARKDIDNYIASLVPASQLKVATSIAGRGAMLLSVKSPLTNIISNTVMGITQSFERRLASGTYKGLNNDFALEYVKKVNEIYQASGFDVSRLESIDAGQKRLGEEIISAQGEGPVRKLGQWYEDVVFKQMMGAPDVAFSAVAFADSANLASSKLSKGDKAKALEIFQDAVKIQPETVNGEIVRAQAISDAQYSTYTNKGGYSDFAMAIRTAINNATGDTRLGDQIMPFVKTPANVVQAGIDAAGVGAFRGFYKLPEAIAQMKQGNGEPMREAVRLFTRSGLGFTLALVLAHAFDPDDFIGEYDFLSQKERDLAKAKNAPYNSIKVGDKYISLDYFGPLASAFVGIMYAKKYGDSLPSKIYQYAKGAGTQAVKVPGLREFSGLVDGITASLNSKEPGKVGQELTDQAIGYIRARTIPAIVNDFAKGVDNTERETGGDAVSQAKASIPGLRQTLPAKLNQQTGEPVKGEGFISTLLFGNRVKTATNSEVVNELERLYDVKEGPAMSDIKKSSKRVEELKSQISKEKFNEAIEFYGDIYSKEAEKALKTTDYKRSIDEEKKKILNKIRETSIERMLKKYGYKRPEKAK